MVWTPAQPDRPEGPSRSRLVARSAFTWGAFLVMVLLAAGIGHVVTGRDRVTLGGPQTFTDGDVRLDVALPDGWATLRLPALLVVAREGPAADDRELRVRVEPTRPWRSAEDYLRAEYGDAWVVPPRPVRFGDRRGAMVTVLAYVSPITGDDAGLPGVRRPAYVTVAVTDPADGFVVRVEIAGTSRLDGRDALLVKDVAGTVTVTGGMPRSPAL